jgi:hypothetical protein
MQRFTVLLVAAIFLLSFTTPNTSPSLFVKESVSRKGILTKHNFNDSIKNLYDHLKLGKAGLQFEAFQYGMVGYHNLRNQGKLNESKNLFTIIDFTQPSTAKRFYTIDFDKLSLKYHTYVAHGKNTGENMASHFSNIPHSNQSSLGFYVTGETYVGSKGYSLRLDGVEPKFNSNMRKRAVVIHGADYVSEAWIKRYGRLGRSQGCPALPKELSRTIINSIKNKTAIFAYYKSNDYLKSSVCLDVEGLMKSLEEQETLLASGSFASE